MLSSPPSFRWPLRITLSLPTTSFSGIGEQRASVSPPSLLDSRRALYPRSGALHSSLLSSGPGGVEIKRDGMKGTEKGVLDR